MEADEKIDSAALARVSSKQLTAADHDHDHDHGDVTEPGEKTPTLTDDEQKPSIGDGPTTTVEEEYPTGIRFWGVFLAILFVIFLGSLDLTIVATAIPKITDEFHGLDKVAWYGSAFFLTNAGFQASWGKFYRYFSLKYSFLAAVLIFMLGSLICALSKNSTTLIVGRAITGLGGAGISTGAYTMIAFIAPPAKRPTYIGFIGMAFGIASVAGPLIGGALTSEVTWRWCFWINLPIAGFGAGLILVFFQTPASAKPVVASWKEKFLQLDLVGVALIMGAIITYALAFQQGGQALPWKSSRIIGLLVGCGLLCIAFGIWERWQGERAMFVPRLIGRRVICVSNIYAFLTAGPYFLTIYELPIYFQSVAGISPTMSGVYNLPFIIASTIFIIASGVSVTKSGGRLAAPLQIFGAAIATVAGGLLYTLGPERELGRWIGYQILAGFGWGLLIQVPLMASQASVEANPEDIAPISAMILFSQCSGGVVFLTAAQAGFVNRLIKVLPELAPGVDPAQVVLTGATMIRDAFTPEQVPGIVLAYTMGIKVAFTLVIAGCGVGFLVSLAAKWGKFREDEKPDDEEANVGGVVDEKKEEKK